MAVNLVLYSHQDTKSIRSPAAIKVDAKFSESIELYFSQRLSIVLPMLAGKYSRVGSTSAERDLTTHGNRSAAVGYSP